MLRKAAVIALGVAAIAGQWAAADTYNWTGESDFTWFWSDANNWYEQSPPPSGNDVVFGPVAQYYLTNYNDLVDLWLNKLVVSTPAENVVINGNPIGLGTGGIEMFNATHNLTLAIDVNVRSSQTWNIVNSGTLTVTGRVYVPLDQTLTINTDSPGQARVTELSGVVDGRGGLIVTGRDRLFLSGSNNTYSGGTQIDGGRLQVADAQSLGTLDIDKTQLFFDNQGTLIVDHTMQLDHRMRIRGGGAILQVENTLLPTFLAIREPVGAGLLRKTAGGTLSILPPAKDGGRDDGFTGPIQIEAGTLQTNNTLTGPGGPITIFDGATLRTQGVCQRPIHGTGTIVTMGHLVIGDLNKAGAFDFGGAMYVMDNTTTAVMAADVATLGRTTALGMEARFVSVNGAHVPYDCTFTKITDVANVYVEGAFKNDGTVIGPAGPGKFMTFFDDVWGAGDFEGNCRFEGRLRPGNSPAEVRFENVDFVGSTVLEIELGGLNVGTQYDQIDVSGLLHLDGLLDIHLFNEFVPTPGSTFDIMDFDPARREGTFADVAWPTLPPGLAWDDTDLYLTGEITVVPEPQSIVLLVMASGLMLRPRGQTARPRRNRHS